MKNLLRVLLPMKSPKPASRAVRRARPELEALEDRLTPSVSPYGPTYPVSPWAEAYNDSSNRTVAYTEGG
jgi:hypothetical protein